MFLLLGDSPSCILMLCPFKFGCPYSNVEHSLKIQKQKQGMNDARADNSEKQHSNYNQPDNESMKSWVLEQRIRQLEVVYFLF
jgi:hypothetical protein